MYGADGYTQFSIDNPYHIAYEDRRHTQFNIAHHIENGIVMLIRKSSDLGTVIRDARRDRKWSQAELAKRAGLHQPKISEIETGKSDPNIETILKVIAPLQLTINIAAAGSTDQTATVINPEEPDYDDDFDLDTIADTGIRK
jgi:HTH-type transcriptional regulator/antitoxin HipB